MNRDAYEDRYFYPDSTVLKNRHDIKDRQKLLLYEYEATGARAKELEKNPIKGNFDLNHLQEIHGYLFQDVYEWAGKTREIDIAKRTDEKHYSQFADPSEFESISDILQDELAKADFLKSLSSNEVAVSLTKAYVALNIMHPFPEGNGRATRILISQMARDAGFTVDYSKVDKSEWNAAAAGTMPQYHLRNGELKKVGDLAPMLSVFQKITSQIEMYKQQAPEISGPER
jgi:cell filamentation protein